MDVDAAAVTLGEGEDDIQVTVAVTIDPDGIEPADEIRAHPQGRVQVARDRRAAQDPALREGDDLDLQAVGPARPQVEDLGEMVEPRDVVDVDMGSQARRAAAEQAFKQRLGALLGERDPRGPAERLLVRDDRADRACRRVRAPRETEQALVEVDVAIGQTRQHQGAAEIDRTGGGGTAAHRDPAGRPRGRPGCRCSSGGPRRAWRR